jgi:hypothetical protein
MPRRRKDGVAPAAAPGRAKLLYARYMNSRITYYGSLIFFGLVLMGVVVVFFFPSGKPAAGKPTVADVPVVTTAPSTSAPDGRINGCGPQDAVAVPPETVSKTVYNTTWTATGSMSVPTSEVGGPWISGPPAHCFNRNPEGALYAMATFVAEMASTTSNREMADLITARGLPDNNAEAYLRKLQAAPEITGQPMISVTGYRWQEYSPDRAVAELQFRRDSGSESGTTTSQLYGVIWQQNDWLILVPNPTTPTKLPDSQYRTFHPWGGA